MKNLVTLMVLGMVVTSATFASGFKCEATDDSGYSAKLFNHVSGATRTPAVLVVSQKGAGTLLKVDGEEIRKTNRANTVRYTVEGNSKTADQVILQISFKEGREVIEAGESADAQLIFVTEGQRDVVPMECVRYLKNN